MQRVMAPRGLARCLATDTAARTRRAPRGRHVVVPRSMGVVGRANVRRAWWGAAGLPGASTTSGAVSPGAWGRSAGGSCPPQGRGPRVAARAAGHGPARAGCARPGAPPPRRGRWGRHAPGQGLGGHGPALPPPRRRPGARGDRHRRRPRGPARDEHTSAPLEGAPDRTPEAAAGKPCRPPACEEPRFAGERRAGSPDGPNGRPQGWQCWGWVP